MSAAVSQYAAIMPLVEKRGLIALARERGLLDVEFFTETVPGGRVLMGLAGFWKGEKYELSFDVTNASPAVVDVQLEMLRGALERFPPQEGARP